MIERRPFDSLGEADHGWLNAKHHFSFAEYRDPERMGWGPFHLSARSRSIGRAPYPEKALLSLQSCINAYRPTYF
jgi:hypothetical protein